MISDFIQKYKAKTGDAFSIPDGFQIAFDEQHGFFIFGFSKWDNRDWLEIQQTCVDSWLWVFGAVVETIIDNGLAGVLTYTRRNPKAYARLTGAKYIETLPGNCHMFILEVQDVEFK